MRLSFKSRLLSSSIAATAALAMSVTAAQAQVVDEDDDEIVVVGTRLNVNPNLTAANPVLLVSDEEIAIRGTVNIEDLTNNLPQVFAGQAGEVSNGSSGTSTLNLRGLGSTRTLTLVDGRRLPYGSSSFSPVNLDLVPTNLVDRVEILTGGASAVYGSDAIGGVANFVLKRDFQGIEVDAQYSFEQNDNGIDLFEDVLNAANQPIPGSVTDGEQYNVSLTIGANTADGRGNVTVFGAYQDREAVVQADRSFSACTLGSGDTNGFGCVGSGNFRLFAGPGGLAFQQESGEIVNFFDVSGPERTFNFGAQNFFQRPQERIQIYGKGHYELTEFAEVYGDISYTNNFSDAQIAPTASFGFGAYQINCDNPFIQDTNGLNLATDIYGCTQDQIDNGDIVDGITASHRNVEGGPRNSRNENEAVRFSAGLRGDLGEAVSYDTFAQFSRTNDESISTNDFIVANLQQAFLVRNDAEGNPVCIDPSGGCVPYNIFQRSASGETLVTQDALDFIQGIGITTGETEQLVLGGNIQADLGEYDFRSPLAEDTSIGVLAGVEFRKDSLQATPDQISQIPGGGFTGVGGATLPVEGEVEVFELFGEIELPLVTGMTGIEELVLNAAYRYSDYTSNGNGVEDSFSTDAYGVQLAYSPIADLKFRGQYQRSVRAPNVIELFTGQNTGLPNLNLGVNGNFDPCSGPNPAASLAACQNTGVTAAQYGTIADVIAGQTQSITGGNPLLDPEKSDTFTLGAVITLPGVDGLTMSVDYFNIKLDDAIAGGIAAQVALDNCLETGDATFCNLINRDSSGSLNAGTAGVGFQQTNINIASLETEGLDMQVGYLFDLGRFGLESVGDFGLQYAGTFVDEFTETPFPGADPIRCAGFYGNQCSPVNSEYRHRAVASWETPLEGLELNATWRHFSEVDNISQNPAVTDVRFAARDYIDLSTRFEFLEGVTARAGVNNVFLEQPPISVSAGPALGNGNTYPTIYDTGRFFFFGLNVAFD